MNTDQPTTPRQLRMDFDLLESGQQKFDLDTLCGAWYNPTVERGDITMAKAKATCTCNMCGNNFVRETIKRNCAEAENWAKWAITYYNECPDCEAKRRDDARREVSEIAAAKGWAGLTGSIKQRAWAEDIRMAGITKLDAMIANAEAKNAEAKNPKENSAIARVKDMRDQIAHIAEAGWWIDNRTMFDGETVNIKLLYRDLQKEVIS